jgi:hypothetical protein
MENKIIGTFSARSTEERLEIDAKTYGGLGEIVGRQIEVQEAAQHGLYHGALRNDPEYKRLLEDLSDKVKIGWVRKLLAAVTLKPLGFSVLEALDAAGIAYPKGWARVDYRVHDEWLVHEIATLKSFFDSKPTWIEGVRALRQRRNFHRVHQFKGFTHMVPRGTTQKTYIPLWERVYP